ncbi:MAG: sigma-70 family RNA polymerase sigma factor [Wenzhouxiangellaceae bacterium]|nr:sigma-70 family RNA polymerase sigma factor [Wenzhouxiangellaceae bacterium]
MQKKPSKDADAVPDGQDAPAFDCVLRAWHTHQRELRGFLVRRLGDRAAADDMLHDVFIRAMREGQGFCKLENPRAWLFRVARNAAIDRERLVRPTSQLHDRMRAPQLESEPVEKLQECLGRNLSRLSENDREIIRRCDLEGMRQADFAAETGLSLAATKSRLLRARARLRELLVSNCSVRFDDSGSVCCHRAPTSGRLGAFEPTTGN